MITIHCNNQEQLEQNYGKHLRIRKDKVVFKLYDGDTFAGSRIVPTSKFPSLNDEIHVFGKGNTLQVDNEEIIKIVDSIDFRIGRCYHNAESLRDELLKHGYPAKMFCGWFLLCANVKPVHHAWVMLDNHLIDLSDESQLLFEEFKKRGNITREEMADWNIEILKLSNSKRIAPVGEITTDLLYIGSECESAKQGIMQYNEIMRTYPDHEAGSNINSQGMSPLQAELNRRGVMR